MDQRSAARLLVDAFWVFLVGIVACWLFFVVIGGVKPGDTVGLSIVMVGLLLLCLGRAWAQNHNKNRQRDRRLVAARERRGF
jgi:hypothetical protein